LKKDPVVFIGYIIECIELIEKYLEGNSREDFFSRTQLQDSIIRRIEIIGEAVKNLPGDFRNEHQEVPWQEIAGMRDILIHEYFGIDLDLTWEAVKTDIPDLKMKILKIKEELLRAL
jgi:uncharacterized protein with HEPN domain